MCAVIIMNSKFKYKIRDSVYNKGLFLIFINELLKNFLERVFIIFIVNGWCKKP